MTGVHIRESTSGAVLMLISKDDLIDDEEPTVGDSDMNSIGRRQESNPGDSILESADDFKSNLAVTMRETKGKTLYGA